MNSSLIPSLLLALCALLTFPVEARAQGTILFYNHVPAEGVNAPVFDVGGVVPLAGDAFLAQLFVGPDAGSLTPAGSAQPFQGPGPGAGYWVPSVVAVPGVAAGGSVTVQVRAWRAADGATHAAAAAQGGPVGSSSAFQIQTGPGVPVSGQPAGFPTALRGLTSFSLVPEPSITALIAIAALTLRLRRRSG